MELIGTFWHGYTGGEGGSVVDGGQRLQEGQVGGWSSGMPAMQVSVVLPFPLESCP